MTVFVEASIDQAYGPNQIVDGSGWVLVDRFAVGATTDSDQLTRSILSTARLVPQRGESTDGATASEDTWTFEQDGVTVTALSSWFAKDCGGFVQITPRVGCSPPADAEGVRFLDTRSFQPSMGEGVVIESQDNGVILWGGYVLRGDYAVFVTQPDKETAQQFVSLVR